MQRSKKIALFRAGYIRGGIGSGVCQRLNVKSLQRLLAMLAIRIKGVWYFTACSGDWLTMVLTTDSTGSGSNAIQYSRVGLLGWDGIRQTHTDGSVDRTGRYHDVCIGQSVFKLAFCGGILFECTVTGVSMSKPLNKMPQVADINLIVRHTILRHGQYQ